MNKEIIFSLSFPASSPSSLLKVPNMSVLCGTRRVCPLVTKLTYPPQEGVSDAETVARTQMEEKNPLQIRPELIHSFDVTPTEPNRKMNDMIIAVVIQLKYYF